jgi:hypothetical protein
MDSATARRMTGSSCAPMTNSNAQGDGLAPLLRRPGQAQRDPGSFQVGLVPLG